jgi:hypothetical protein
MKKITSIILCIAVLLACVVLFSACKDTSPAPGLYDADGNLLASWDELVNTYGLDITKELTAFDIMEKEFSLSTLLTTKFELSTGVNLVVGKVAKIGNYAFSNCSMLTDITINNSVKSIGIYAFYNCTGLKNVTLSKNTTVINPNMFSDCTSLTSITIPDSVTNIGAGAFMSCTSLTSITIPDSVTSIEFFAFYDCQSLASITFEGTTEEWKAIIKGSDWNESVPATVVVCSDGKVKLK